MTRRIAAVEQVAEQSEPARAGFVKQLEPGVALVICGQGFSEQTVQVRYAGKHYFVFLEDLPQSTS